MQYLKQSGYTKKHVFERIYFMFLCVIAAVIPFHNTISTVPLLLALTALILSGGYSEKLRRLKNRPLAFLIASLYILYAAGAMISSDKNASLFDLQVKLSLLLIPLLVAASPAMPLNKLHIILKVFVCACGLFAATALVRAAYFYFLHAGNYFYYKDLVSFTKIHPSYEGLFITFTIVIISLHLISKWNMLTAGSKASHIFLCLFFILFLFLLSAKTAIISCFIFLNIALVYALRLKYSFIKCMMCLLAVNIAGLIFLLSLPGTRGRFALLFSYDEVSYINSTASRTEIWHSSKEMLQHVWLTGTGTGDVNNDLVTYYEKNNFQSGTEERYNAHNQYMQVFLATGILGFVFLVLYFVNLIFFSAKNKNYLHLCFLGLFGINIFTECMLETQSGVVFFAFFNSLLLLRNNNIYLENS